MDETPSGAVAPETIPLPAAAEEPPEDAGVRHCRVCGSEYGVNLAGDAKRSIAPVPAGTRLACPVCRTVE